ncbi:MAG: hypothetical protein ACI9EW_000186 [Cellvibrionaceae bacterium]|jgi:hypothetical protein
MNGIEEQAKKALAEIFLKSRDQFGDALKSFWFYEPDPCPGCGREIDTVKLQSGRGLSMNTFIYRKRGILIGYFLCGRCGKRIHDGAAKNPGKETDLHAKIEESLIKGYERKLN